MRIGYFGGSFDPPHRGHLTVARAARDRFALDRVLLTPTGRQPLKPGGPLASFADRLQMTELLCMGEPGLEASAIDAPRPDGEPNYTVDTLRRLRDGLPDGTELFAIVGADAFATLPQWRSAGDLLRLAEWIVVSRPGVSAPATPGSQAGQVHILDGVADPASATALRKQLRLRESCADVLPAPVLAYVREHGLYRGAVASGETG